jgi:type VI protein secretion system component Hcp
LIDAASPLLIKHVLNGKTIGEGVIAAATSNHAPFDYYRVKLSGVSIESVVQSDSGNSSGTIVESVSMSAARFEIVYTPTSMDGSAQGEVRFTWNCDQGKEP